MRRTSEHYLFPKPSKPVEKRSIERVSVCLDNVVREHIGNASQLLSVLRDTAFKRESGDFLEGSCRRGEANLDALRIAGETAIEIGLAEMENDAEVAGVIALLLAESEGHQPATSGRAVTMLNDDVAEIRQAAWSGLRLANPRHVQQHLRGLLGKPKWNFASAAALDILAFHRFPSQSDLGDLADEESGEIAWLLAEAGGRMKFGWNVARLRQFTRHPSTRVREAALRASARCGLPELPALCREAASQMNPRELETIEFLGVVGSREDLSLLRRTASDPLTAMAALAALGRLGLPASVPMLLEFLSAPETADCAAAAIERIAGQQVPRGARPDPLAGLTEDELDLWEPKPPVDVARANDWWKSNAARFDPNKRWQAGLCVSDDPLGVVFDQLPLGIRYDVYLRQRVLVPGTPDWELETWSWKQKNPGG
jgi:hypothetical protein